MPSPDELKTFLHKDIQRLDKLLLILSAIGKPCELKDIRRTAAGAGLRIPKNWNIADTLAKSKGLAIRVPDGWELTSEGQLHLKHQGFSKLSPASHLIATDLRAHMQRIKDPSIQAFVEEAIKCHEAGLYRSAIVMSWLAAIGVLQHEVVQNHLSRFNTEATRRNPKWKAAKNEDDLGHISEFDFLDHLVAISVIGKNRKDELQKALKLRNGCGHPNSLRVGPNAVAGHIEILLLNVFDVFNS